MQSHEAFSAWFDQSPIRAGPLLARDRTLSWSWLKRAPILLFSRLPLRAASMTDAGCPHHSPTLARAVARFTLQTSPRRLHAPFNAIAAALDAHGKEPVTRLS